MPERKYSDQQIEDKMLEITKLLESYSIPVNQWGKGKAKTIRDLAIEVLEGETTLVHGNNGLVRKVATIKVDIRYVNNDIELQLIEDRQIFEDGRERKRGLIGVSDKIKSKENSLDAVRRALREEIGFKEVTSIQLLESLDKNEISPSYPGLTTSYHLVNARILLPDFAFNPLGYTEVRDGMTTEFRWRKAKRPVYVDIIN